ncbi:UNVERIFIED_CONTAM: hypothetical protein LK11_03200 [Mumia flava]
MAALLALLIGAGVLIAGAPTASATPQSTGVTASEEDPTSVVRGRITNPADDGAGVAGATIVITPPEGEPISIETGDDGSFEAEVPALGATEIELDTDSLPDGVELREGARNPLTVTLNSGRPSITVAFAIGPDTRQVSQWYDDIPQLIYQGIYFGTILALGSLGLSMIFGTTGLSNFAHGELVTFGAIVTYLFNSNGMSIWLAGLCAIALGLAFGWVQDRVLWRPLRHRGTTLIAMMIVSIGLQFFLRYGYGFLTGGETETYRDFTTPTGYSLGPISYTLRDLFFLVVAAVLLLVVTQALSRTRLGRATRAVADNPALAASSGINTDRVITIVWVGGTALAAICGIMLGFTQAVKFDLGAQILLVMFAAVVVGGLGTIGGAILGSILVGLMIELSTLVVPSELKFATALILLVVILLFRPQGLLGRKERIG